MRPPRSALSPFLLSALLGVLWAVSPPFAMLPWAGAALGWDVQVRCSSQGARRKGDPAMKALATRLRRETTLAIKASAPGKARRLANLG